jgi:hypothetical protein
MIGAGRGQRGRGGSWALIAIAGQDDLRVIMQDKRPEASDPWPADWGEPRIADLLHFAIPTPDEKLQWLEEMLELMEAVRQAGPPRSDGSATPIEREQSRL